MELKVLASVHINSKAVVANGKLLFYNEGSEGFKAFARSVYKGMNIKYPKFFKMDELCKLSFLAAEILTPHIHGAESDEVALVVGNNHSSISSDIKHYNAIANRNNYFPSPSVFVYTLPNIMLGEICIRHKFTGENSCFMMSDLDSAFLYGYVYRLFEEEKYKYCLTGFVDFSHETYLAKLFLIGEEGKVAEGPLNHTFDNQFNITIL